ncbi:GNAT family N-acetyltransferase [Salinimicrobium terrae]|uniref:GNAT family N-acetyltransferase n=1 Tax=Salinimicrobium terrae TaxID=470866 RepID=UPI0004905503|nr:GNAT family N-acetyltransferase [Salinimicrobium terrae]
MILNIRKATEEDCSLLFKWVNNEDVRKNVLNPERINWTKHESWFRKKIDDPNSVIYILEKDNYPIGQVRYDRNEEDFWDIDFFIDPNFRSLGFGKKIIELTLGEITGSVRALVKKDNVVSRKVFEKLGFQGLESKEGIFQYIFR